MDPLRDEFLQIEGVKNGPVNDSFLCLTSEALIELCKKGGFFLWAEKNDNAFDSELSQRLSDGSTACCLKMALPCSDDVLFLDGGNRGIMAEPSPIWVRQELLRDLNEEMKNDMSKVRRVSSWPIERSFVYFDVSDFSKEKATKEVFIINSLIRAATTDRYWPGGFVAQAKKDVEASLCIGDGYIFVFRQVWCAVFFAGYLANLLENLIAKERLPVEFHFRIGVHVGPVYCFWDAGRGKGGDWNYIGDGINGGQRVLAAIGKETDDVVFVSGEVRKALRKEHDVNGPVPNILDNLHNRGRRADKHGNFWRVYELHHTDALGAYLHGVVI